MNQASSFTKPSSCYRPCTGTFYTFLIMRVYPIAIQCFVKRLYYDIILLLFFEAVEVAVRGDT